MQQLEQSENTQPKTNIEARDDLTKNIRLELVGPDNEEDQGNDSLLNEVLHIESPLTRYKVGVLYPKKTQDSEEETIQIIDEIEQAAKQNDASVLSENAEEQIREMQSRQDFDPASDDDEEGNKGIADLSYSGLYRPASLAISFFIAPGPYSPNATLKLSFNGGIYLKQQEEKYIAWRRMPLTLMDEFSISELLQFKKKEINLQPKGENYGISDVTLRMIVRQRQTGGALITLTAINETPAIRDGKKISDNSRAIFQVKIKAEVFSKETGQAVHGIAPYSTDAAKISDSSEEASLELLFRNFKTFAVGHGCSAQWSTVKDNKVKSVSSISLPSYEINSVTPDLAKNAEGTEFLKVSMADLASGKPSGFDTINEIIDLYEGWIKDRREEIDSLESNLISAAKQNLSKCADALRRIKNGRDFLRKDQNALRAFQLANEAILIQQKRASDKKRKLGFDEDSKRVFFSDPFISTEELLKNEDGKGYWRPFQIAFLLMSIQSAALGSSEDREVVDLIWFPTGGGKTEAYFGLAAFSILYRRISNPNDLGVAAIMRYTLRLLTADQFERSAGLICALEHLRKTKGINLLGNDPFSIGIWLGQKTTPNKKSDAALNLKNLLDARGKTAKAKSKLMLTKCPWCSAELGILQTKKSKIAQGYKHEESSVRYYCPDSRCDFRDSLPIYIVDEDIYEKRPTLLIGTVDKFAQLAWNSRVRNIFGLDNEGERIFSPPGLIIQDELHLISGPLGSMVGLYETLIEELCTDYRGRTPIRPKIVCATATIKRYEEQIRALFARRETCLFPPPGLSIEDSFFAKWLPHEKQRGRKYIGIYGAGESIQTMQVRTLAIALQGAKFLPDTLRDAWWTLLIFFNSLRELGTTISLFQSDIATRLKILRRRMGYDKERVRWLNNLLELTGRIQDDEVEQARANLKKTYLPASNKQEALDVCLASNIIEVGIDIGRLSLMAIVGQPKTTAQYIQVSGRVGRKPEERPGLVLTIYSASKPRDRSHFEKFRTYHERLYALVEPTSITPFSGPALDRALHAVIVGYIRQRAPASLDKIWPMPEEHISEIVEKIHKRVEKIYKGTHDFEYIKKETQQAITYFLDTWRTYEIENWETRANADLGLLYRAGTYIHPTMRNIAFKTLQSMRNVDLECQGDISVPERELV